MDDHLISIFHYTNLGGAPTTIALQNVMIIPGWMNVEYLDRQFLSIYFFFQSRVSPAMMRSSLLTARLPAMLVIFLQVVCTPCDGCLSGMWFSVGVSGQG